MGEVYGMQIICYVKYVSKELSSEEQKLKIGI